MGCLPRLPLTVLDISNVAGYQSPNRDQLPYVDLATARQQGIRRGVLELYAIYVSCIHRRNATLMDALWLLRPFSVNGWSWICNSAAIIRRIDGKDTDAIVPKANLSNYYSFKWIDCFMILAVDPQPASAVPDGRPIHDKLLYCNLPSHMPGCDSEPRVSNLRYKQCRNPD